MSSEAVDIVPAHLAVKAMRDNGYKNAAYALAELMDNSIQAGATQVEMLCGERRPLLRVAHVVSWSRLPFSITGKECLPKFCRWPSSLETALVWTKKIVQVWANSAWACPLHRSSQAQRVEVWTWRNGSDNAIYSYLDVEQMRKKELIGCSSPREETNSRCVEGYRF